MNKLNVYLSSPFMEFKDIREKFLHEIQSRSYLYEINAMEHYRAEDRNVLYKCIEDVNKCNIYVLVLGDKYGSLAKDKNDIDTGKSFTRWEYDTANKRKAGGDDIERLILLKAGPADPGEDPLLTKWKKEIADSQTQTIYYNEQGEIPKKILESLDNFTLKRLEASIRKKDVLLDKIYLCNRTEVNNEFRILLGQSPIQFFVFNCHEQDCYDYFVKRKELEYADEEIQWKNIDIWPDIPVSVKDFDKADNFIKSEILYQTGGKTLHPASFTPEMMVNHILKYMDKNDIRYLSISWFILKSFWNNKDQQKLLQSFYETYSAINSRLQTDRYILFLGILQYVNDSRNTVKEEEFFKKIKKIKWVNDPLKLNKINRLHIKNWLAENEIEEIESRKEELINLYLKDIYSQDMYYKEVETGLKKILDMYNH